MIWRPCATTEGVRHRRGYDTHPDEQLLEIAKIVQETRKPFSSAKLSLFFKANTDGVLAQLFLHATEAVRAGKNWNSHAANTGTSLCTFALMLIDIGKVNGPCKDPLLEMPTAKTLCGSPRGHPDNIYFEYMTVEGPPLTPYRITVDSARINQIFDSHKLTPSKSCTPDWVVAYGGCPLLLGEGKSSGESAGLALQCCLVPKLIAHSDIGVTMQSSSHAFKLGVHYEVEIPTKIGESNYYTKELKSEFFVSRRFNLIGKENVQVEQVNECAQPPAIKTQVVMGTWSTLRDTDRQFLTAYFQTMDTLFKLWAKVDFEAAKTAYMTNYHLAPVPTSVADQGALVTDPASFIYDTNIIYPEIGECDE